MGASRSMFTCVLSISASNPSKPASPASTRVFHSSQLHISECERTHTHNKQSTWSSPGCEHFMCARQRATRWTCFRGWLCWTARCVGQASELVRRYYTEQTREDEHAHTAHDRPHSRHSCGCSHIPTYIPLNFDLGMQGVRAGHARRVDLAKNNLDYESCKNN